MQLETRVPPCGFLFFDFFLIGGLVPGNSGVLVSSYCCSSYRIADPFISLDTFSSSFIGGPVVHPIDDCEHPLLYLPGTAIASQETAISESRQQNFAGICKCLCLVADYGIESWVG